MHGCHSRRLRYKMAAACFNVKQYRIQNQSSMVCRLRLSMPSIYASFCAGRAAEATGVSDVQLQLCTGKRTQLSALCPCMLQCCIPQLLTWSLQSFLQLLTWSCVRMLAA